MTNYERELLTCLVEECAELQKAACKALRHGLDSTNPTDVESDTNRQDIEHEAGDVFALVDMLVGNNTLSHGNISLWRDGKPMRMQKYLHHCRGEGMIDAMRSAVRDAVRELVPFLEHDYKCHRQGDTCTCGLSALRKKFEVEG